MHTKWHNELSNNNKNPGKKEHDLESNFQQKADPLISRSKKPQVHGPLAKIPLRQSNSEYCFRSSMV